jgi:hypothetical protein
MEPLEIKDGFGDIISITNSIDNGQGTKICHAIIIEDDTNPDNAPCVELIKEDALQIIAHLKQCFNI